MSKYDFQLDLSGNTSTGMILSKIEKGSTVLEFGCATGRMTRYMQQTLGCRVYIVEFEESAFQKAMEYAEDGLCDDIMTFRWREKFQDVRFDAVLFADVLEHLSDPEAVLRSAAELLSDNGTIHVSVPNITHNDVLVKAFRERFDYTKVGLLDNTHVHFWGLENLSELAAGSGLYLKSVEATYCRTGETEQKPQLDEVTARFENMLRQRACGEVYQFVVALTKTACGEPEVYFSAPTARMHLYLETGNGFNENEVVFFEAESDGCGGYCAHYLLPQDHGASRIRLDPVEYQGCILTDLRICQNGEKLPVGFGQNIRMDETVCLLDSDPAVYADIGPGEVELDVRMVLAGAEYERIMQAQVVELQDFKVWANAREQQLLAEISRREHTIAQREHTIAQREHTIAHQNNQLALQRHQTAREIALRENRIAQLQADLRDYITLAEQKDKYILTLKQRATPLGMIRYVFSLAVRVAKSIVRRILGRRSANG